MDNNNRAFKLLNLLYNRQGEYIKSKEILEILNLKTARNIHHMIAKLSALGYTVESKSGYDGGYRIIDNSVLTNEDIEILNTVFSNYISSMKNTYSDSKYDSKYKEILKVKDKISELNKRVRIK